METISRWPTSPKRPRVRANSDPTQVNTRPRFSFGQGFRLRHHGSPLQPGETNNPADPCLGALKRCAGIHWHEAQRRAHRESWRGPGPQVERPQTSGLTASSRYR
jgi:hypothetical protein